MSKSIIFELFKGLEPELLKQNYFSYMNTLSQKGCRLEVTPLRGLDHACRTAASGTSSIDELVFYVVLAPLHQVLLQYAANSTISDELSNFLASVQPELLSATRKKMQDEESFSATATELLEYDFILDWMENDGEKNVCLDAEMRELVNVNPTLTGTGFVSISTTYYNSYDDVNKVFFTTLFFLHMLALEQAAQLATLNATANTLAEDALKQITNAKPDTQGVSAMDFLATNISSKEPSTNASKEKTVTSSDAPNKEYTPDIPADDNIVSFVISMFTTVYNFFYKQFGLVSLILYVVVLVLLAIRKITYPFAVFILTYLVIIMFLDKKKS